MKATIAVLIMACLALAGCSSYNQSQAPKVTPSSVSVAPQTSSVVPVREPQQAVGFDFQSASCAEIAAKVITTDNQSAGQYILQIRYTSDGRFVKFDAFTLTTPGKGRPLIGQFQPLGSGKAVVYDYQLAYVAPGNHQPQIISPVLTSRRPTASECPGVPR